MTFYHNGGFGMVPTPAYEIQFNRWSKIQKLCWWVLKKTSCLVPHFDKSQLVTEVAIDREKATREIVRMAAGQLNLMTGKRPQRILLGRQQFYEIATTEVDIRYSFEFCIELAEPSRVERDPWGQYTSRLRLFSLPVQVVPWMDGVLVL